MSEWITFNVLAYVLLKIRFRQKCPPLYIIYQLTNRTLVKNIQSISVICTGGIWHYTEGRAGLSLLWQRHTAPLLVVCGIILFYLSWFARHLDMNINIDALCSMIVLLPPKTEKLTPHYQNSLNPLSQHRENGN